MAVDIDNLTGGPAEFLIDDVRVSHTQGGVSVKVAPQQRMRVVDQYGSTPIDVIHTGDDVRITAPLAEWSQLVLAEIYAPGNNVTAGSAGARYMGIGRSAGFHYVASDLKIVPLLTAEAGKRSQFYRCVPVGEFELMHNVDDDRVFNTEFVALADPEGAAGATDGQLVGKIFFATT